MKTDIKKLIVRTLFALTCIAAVIAFQRQIHLYQMMQEIETSYVIVDFDKNIIHIKGLTLNGPLILKGTNSHGGTISDFHISSPMYAMRFDGGDGYMIKNGYVDAPIGLLFNDGLIKTEGEIYTGSLGGRDEEWTRWSRWSLEKRKEMGLISGEQ